MFDVKEIKKQDFFDTIKICEYRNGETGLLWGRVDLIPNLHTSSDLSSFMEYNKAPGSLDCSLSRIGK